MAYVFLGLKKKKTLRINSRDFPLVKIFLSSLLFASRTPFFRFNWASFLKCVYLIVLKLLFYNAYGFTPNTYFYIKTLFQNTFSVCSLRYKL